MLETTRTSCFTKILISPVHSTSISLVWRTTIIICYDWQDDSSFDKVPKTSHSLRFHDDLNIISTFWKFEPCTTQTTFLRYEWHENSTLRKVAGTAHISWLTMTVKSFVHSASLSLVGRTTSIPFYERRKNSVFQKKSYLLFHDDCNVLSTFCKFQPSKTQDEFSSLWVTA